MKFSLAILALVASSSALADTYSIQFGGEKGTRRLTVNRVYEPSYVTRFGDYSIMLYPEAGVSLWNGPNGKSVQLSAIPMFRANLNPRWFIEAGVGLSVFTHTSFARDDINTHYQFADHIGIGWRHGPSQVYGIRYSHFSNAGLKEPNPGVNALQVSYTVKF